MPKVTIHDVAREASVSVGTVYRAINNKDRISFETQQRVLETVERLGYKANTVARGLALHGKFTILFILPIKPEFFWDDVLKGCHRAADKLSEFGVKVIIHRYMNYRVTGTNEEDDEIILPLLKERKVDGIILCAVRYKDKAKKIVECAERENIPYCYLNEPGEGLRSLFFYGPDNCLAGRMAAELMIKFTSRQGPYLTVSTKKTTTDGLRERSFRKYILENTTEECHSLVCPETEVCHEMLEDFLKSHPGIRGVYLVQHTPMVNALPVLEAVPGLAVIGHECSEKAEQALKRGTVTALLAQEKVCQGYRPTMMLYDYLVTGEKPDR
ncbi:MAG: substrate-binding domain-containing protein, partial [Clostridiales bacterium]|nr:substrate-binding domain-containing protein [Clostridiales bacterium]